MIKGIFDCGIQSRSTKDLYEMKGSEIKLTDKYTPYRKETLRQYYSHVEQFPTKEGQHSPLNRSLSTQSLNHNGVLEYSNDPYMDSPVKNYVGKTITIETNRQIKTSRNHLISKISTIKRPLQT